MQRHPEAAGVLHGAQVEDLGAVGGQLQGLLAGEGLDALGGGDDAGVGGEQAVDVGVDLADVGVEGRGQGDRGRVGAAAPQSGGVLDLVDALEAGDDGDRAGLDGAGHALGQHADDGGLAVLGVGEDACLGAGVGARRDAELGDGHGEQGHGDALTGGQQDVHLAGGGVGGQGGGLVEELVGRVPHRGDDDNNRVAGLAGGDDAPCDAPHRVDVADGRAAVLLDDQCHKALLGSWNQCVSSIRCSAPVRASWQGLPGVEPSPCGAHDDVAGASIRCAVLPTHHAAPGARSAASAHSRRPTLRQNSQKRPGAASSMKILSKCGGAESHPTHTIERTRQAPARAKPWRPTAIDASRAPSQTSSPERPSSSTSGPPSAGP